MAPRVSVIIVNYNAGLELVGCVQSVARTNIDLEIHVIDNASCDGSIAALQSQYDGDKPLNIITNKRNMGFAVACNMGARVATGAYLFFLNPDCLLEPKTLPMLLLDLENEPQAGMAGGLIVNSDGSEQRGCRREIPTPGKSFINTFGLKRLARFNTKMFADFRLDRDPLPEKAIAVEAISGACMLVKREAYEDVGPMDENYFLHCEDLDWCMRFMNKGWKILFVPQARLYHNKGLCSASRPVFVEWSKHKGMVRFYRKFFKARHGKTMSAFVLLGIWMRFGLMLCFILTRKVIQIRKTV